MSLADDRNKTDCFTAFLGSHPTSRSPQLTFLLFSFPKASLKWWPCLKALDHTFQSNLSALRPALRRAAQDDYQVPARVSDGSLYKWTGVFFSVFQLIFLWGTYRAANQHSCKPAYTHLSVKTWTTELRITKWFWQKSILHQNRCGQHAPWWPRAAGLCYRFNKP